MERQKLGGGSANGRAQRLWGQLGVERGRDRARMEEEKWQSEKTSTGVYPRPETLRLRSISSTNAEYEHQCY